MADTELQQLAKTDRNPVQETRYQELLKQQGSMGDGSGSIADLAAQQLKMYQEANKPAIASLQASIPEIQNKFAQTGQYLQKQVGTLEQRYKDLLGSITGARDVAVKNVETNTSQELGRRGISAESGLFGQTINRATQPVYQSFAGDVSNLGNAQQSALDSLMNMIQGNTQSSVESQRAVQNAIAQLQAGAGQNAVQTALQMQQQQQAAIEAQKQRDLQLQIAQMSNAPTSSGDTWKIIGDGGMLFNTATGQVIENKKNFAGGGSGGGDGW